MVLGLLKGFGGHLKLVGLRVERKGLSVFIQSLDTKILGPGYTYICLL